MSDLDQRLFQAFTRRHGVTLTAYEVQRLVRTDRATARRIAKARHIAKAK